MSTKLRILLAHNYYALAGGEDVVFEAECDLLEQHGHQVFRITKHNGNIQDAGLRLATSAIWNRESANEVFRFVRENRVDVAHFHNIFPILSPASIVAAKRAGAAVAKTLHNFRMLCPKAVFFRDGRPCYECQTSTIKLPALRHACYRDSRLVTAVSIAMSATHRWLRTYKKSVHAFIAPSEYLRSRYVNSGFPMATIHVKPHFVERDLGFASGAAGYAIFVGRLSEEKGLRTLLDAARQLPNVPFKIVGVGPDSCLLESLPSHITWLGQLEREEVCRLLGDAACLIVSSGCGESFGKVIVEAFSRGTPVICSAHGGQAELVNSELGAQFAPTDANCLLDKLRWFFSNPQCWEAKRRAARNEYLQKYTAETNYDRIIEIYQHAIEARDRSNGHVHHN